MIYRRELMWTKFLALWVYILVKQNKTKQKTRINPLIPGVLSTVLKVAQSKEIENDVGSEQGREWQC